ncbi:MAG: hypothetical protein AB7V21_00090 [Phycisphaerales bacterium]
MLISRLQRPSSAPVSGRTDKPKAWNIAARRTVIALIWLAIAGVALAAGVGEVGPSVLWSFGLMTSGMFIGFLFALPRASEFRTITKIASAADAAEAAIPSGGPGSSASPITRRPDDALIEIADWLTKIIVGLGLVNLTQVPSLLSRLSVEIAAACKPLDHVGHEMAIRELEASANRLSQAIASSEQKLIGPDIVTEIMTALGSGGASMYQTERSFSVALSMTVYFPLIGLLIAYLITRLHIQTALLSGDRDALSVSHYQTDMSEFAHNVRLAQTIMRPVAGTSASKKTPNADVAATLCSLNRQYESVVIAGDPMRRAEKDQLAFAMLSLAVQHDISRTWLASQTGEGYSHVLATMCMGAPQPSDVSLLLQAGSRIVQKYTKYRIAESVQKLNDFGLVQDNDRIPLRQLLEGYKAGADESLLRRLNMSLANLG